MTGDGSCALGRCRQRESEQVISKGNILLIGWALTGEWLAVGAQSDDAGTESHRDRGNEEEYVEGRDCHNDEYASPSHICDSAFALFTASVSNSFHPFCR